MKMAVLYFSKTDHTKQMAQIIAEGMKLAGGIEPRTFSIDEIDEDFLRESKGVILGTPTYLANMAADVKVWLDQSGKYKLAGKIGGAFATAGYVHGGGEIAIQNILSHLMVLGMLVYSGGGAYGRPVIHLGPVAITERLDEYQETFRLYGQRMAEKTKEIFG